MRKHVRLIVFCLSAWLGPLPATAQGVPQDRSSASIFVYHRIGEDQNPESSIRLEQFEDQIRDLTSGSYHVMGLPEVVAALKNGDTLPDNTVALTFDGGHRSVLELAVPLLEKNGLPYTLFIPPGPLDRRAPQYISWDEIKRLRRAKNVTIGLHPSDYTRLQDDPESEIARQINAARASFRKELGEDPRFFAYPFGEYSASYRSVIEKQGFEAAFGQQSGVAYSGGDVLALPRFPVTESFGDLDRFRLSAHALPLPVTDIEPKDPLLDTAAPPIGFTISPDLEAQASNISCFVSGQDKPELQIIGKTRVELRPAKPFDTDRIRINCTLPVPQGDSYEDPRWRWFGMLLVMPEGTEEE